MKKTLQDIWYGRLSPGDTAVSQEEDALDEAHIKLRASLDEEQRRLLKAYDDTVAELLAVSDEGDFVCGFRLGARLIIEALCDD